MIANQGKSSLVANIFAVPPSTRKDRSQPVLDILGAENSHDLNHVAIQPVINGVLRANASPVAWPDMIDGRIKHGIFGQGFEMGDELPEVAIGLVNAPCPHAVLVDADQIVLCLVR